MVWNMQSTTDHGDLYNIRSTIYVEDSTPSLGPRMDWAHYHPPIIASIEPIK